VAPERSDHPGPLLERRTRARAPTKKISQRAAQESRRRGQACLTQVLDNPASVAPGGRNAAINHAAGTQGRSVAAGALEPAEVDDGLYAAAVRNGLVADDGQRQTWATIRSGLSAGRQELIGLDDRK
jgi:hypothetical protein